jgi:hypothetical protein
MTGWLARNIQDGMNLRANARQLARMPCAMLASSG